MKSRIAGGCHCGAIRFEAHVHQSSELLDCNCSICARSGFLHLIVPHHEFKLMTGAKILTSYKFGSGQANHLLCSLCGVKSFYQPRSHPECWSLNYNCLDSVHDLTPQIKIFDGQNWETAKTELR